MSTEVVTVDGIDVEVSIDDGDAEATVINDTDDLEELNSMVTETTVEPFNGDGEFTIRRNDVPHLNGCRNVKDIAASDDYHLRYVDFEDEHITVGLGGEP